ncbi:cobalamin biosynthesis protein [Actinoplanes sp. ATCC 53533]|uniref:bifunctional adenosylcobinamide kinase/adenosylcobinamide-phosphate guanylyltransferase n=1 Tax=Actinoplanes sp. ATCC 53533 TaxID=1288362 RepID=UPI000F7759C4|nr:bifunctional adenosylcobinamide kinase/adenosylcobinamide-phosphate guanylyltransferase [Actinoplanes sp. ATCC 53533]RSM58651.1 cobalamin biosynthesis protein [Actinoplanes sp. ATCC 53533]
MSADGWSSVLVLGGIRSGKSAFAETLVAGAASVRYVATAVGGEDDPEWRARIETHQRRRPQSWTTEETGADPARLTAVLAEAKPDDTLLVDDLGGWVAALLDPAQQPNDDPATVTALAAAVRACAARVVLVSPEVGLSLVPTTPVGRAFADALGTANQALAGACDRVAFVVAGRPTWLKTGPDAPAIGTEPQAENDAAPLTVDAAAMHDAMTAHTPATGTPVLPQPEAQTQAPTQTQPPSAEDVVAAHRARTANAATDALHAPTMVLPLVATGTIIEAGMDLPLPDSDAGPDARDRLAGVDLPGGGLGALLEAVEFAAATQGTATPRAWGPVRVLLIDGRHGGGAAAGADVTDAARRADEAEAGEGALARLAATAEADIVVVRTPASGAMEDGPVLDAEAVDAALLQGWKLADAAAEAGRDVLVLGSCGVGTEAAAAAVLAATTGAEPVAVLPRVLVPGGFYDDAAWMVRCAAVRDAMHRIRQESRGAKDILAQLGGADLAVATGALLGAAARRMPVLLDGPLGIAAGLVARDLASQSRHWCLLPDAGTQALVRQGADVLGLTPVVQLGMDLGEGANALAVLPLLRSAIALAGALPVHPALLAGHDAAGPAELPGDEPDPAGSDEEQDFTEPEPAGPGPASV